LEKKDGAWVSSNYGDAKSAYDIKITTGINKLDVEYIPSLPLI